MLLFLLACFQIDEEDWTEWENTYSDPANTNLAPEISEAIISPETQVYNDSTLNCIAVGTDTEDGELAVAYTWTLGGAPIPVTGAILNLELISNVEPEQEVKCIATVTDSFGVEAGSEAAIVVENRNPVVDSIEIDKTNPEANETVTCTATASDADEDAENIVITYSWDAGNGEIGDEAALQLTPELAGVEDILRCTATATDSQGGIGQDEASGTINNTAPEITEVNITPAENITVETELTCSALGSDLNDGLINPTAYAWFNAAVNLGNTAVLQLDSSFASPADTIECQVTLTDAQGLSVTETASVTVENIPPVFTSAAVISPASAVKTGTELTCSATAEDLEDGSLSPSYSWEVNGTQVGTGAVYTVHADDTDVGDDIICIAAVVDNQSTIETSTVFVTVENTSPVISNVEISPTEAYNDSTITCLANFVEPDEELLPSYSWSYGGVNIGTSSSLNLNGLGLLPDASLLCEVYIQDSQGAIAEASADIIIENRAPSAPEISISGTLDSETASSNSELICQADNSVDPDGEAVTYSFQWTSDSGDILLGATLSAAETSIQDMWTCEATASDPRTGATLTTATIEIVNSEPEIQAVAIELETVNNDSTVYNDSTVTCLATIFDPDEELTPEYSWSSGLGGYLGDTATLDLTGLGVEPIDTITCRVFVQDSYSPMVESFATVTLTNRPPNQPTAVLSTDAAGVAYTNDSLFCEAPAVEDPDGDSLLYFFEWSSSSGGFVSGPSVSAAETSAGEEWTCTVRAEDSHGGSASGTRAVTIENTIPQVTEVSFDEDIVYNDSTVSCSANISDLDEVLVPSYSWSYGAMPLTETSDTIDLSQENLLPGANLFCTVTVTDSFQATVSETAQIPVTNRAPSAPTVEITWNSIGYSANPSDDVDLTCSGSGSVDPDGDSVSYSYRWQRSSAANIVQDQYLEDGQTTDGDVWNCTVTASDGELSTTATASTTITVLDWAKCDSLNPMSIADADYHFIGEDAGDQLGRISPLGDVDGDGLDDFIIGTPSTSGGINTDDTGTVYVILGSSLAENPSINISNADYVLYGENGGEQAGMYIAGGGDVDGDGKGDILIAAPEYNGTTNSEGRVYLILGSSLDPANPSFGLNSADYIFAGGTANDRIGDSIAFAGDVDGDGKDDILIGTLRNNSNGENAGTVYLFKGSSITLTGTTAININSADYTFIGENNGDQATKVASAGDIDNDGKDDFLIGAPNFSDGASSPAGRVYVVLGSSLSGLTSGGTGSVTVSLPGSNTYITGTTSSGYFGSAMASGDFNGDGYSDIVIGDYLTDVNSVETGGARIFYASLLTSGGTGPLYDTSASFSLYGEAEGDLAGYSVANAGDINNDGKDDIIISTPFNDEQAENAGKTYLFLSPELITGTTYYLLSSAEYSFVGEASQDHSGSYVNRAGDVNGDGLEDILIATGGFDNNDSSSTSNYGKVSLFLGCD